MRADSAAVPGPQLRSSANAALRAAWGAFLKTRQVHYYVQGGKHLVTRQCLLCQCRLQIADAGAVEMLVDLLRADTATAAAASGALRSLAVNYSSRCPSCPYLLHFC